MHKQRWKRGGARVGVGVQMVKGQSALASSHQLCCFCWCGVCLPCTALLPASTCAAPAGGRSPSGCLQGPIPKMPLAEIAKRKAVGMVGGTQREGWCFVAVLGLGRQVDQYSWS